MQCTAVLASGAQCGREANPDAQLCAFHGSIQFRRDARAFYLARLSAEDEEALAVAAQLEGVDGEIAMLRVLLRRVVGADDIEAFRRGIDTLSRVLQTKHQLDLRATDPLGDTLEAVLERLGSELRDEEPEAERQPLPPLSAAPLTGPTPGGERLVSASPSAGGPAAPAAPAREVEAAELALRYQGGEPEALDLLSRLLEVTILAVLLHYRASQPPSAWTWEDLLQQSRVVLAQLVQHWRPGGSFLAYFFRAFPSAIARYARHLAARGEPVEPSPTSGETPDPEPPTPGLPEAPYSAADLASLPELERQVLVLRAFEGQSMVEIARQVGLDWSQVYRLYQRARARLEGRQRPPDSSGSIAMRRLVQALHSAAGPDRRLPGRNWGMSAAGLNRREYDQLMGRLEGAGAIRSGGHGGRGHLLDRTPAATLARLGISDEPPPNG